MSSANEPACIIAIDGPAGSGKTTAAKMLAEAEGFAHLNTGAMYRAVAYLADEGGLDTRNNPEKVAAVARAMVFEYKSGPGGEPRFLVAPRPGVPKQDCSSLLFTAALTLKLKPVVNNEAVRAELVGKMRTAARQALAGGCPGVVLEGRDIGTVVFPDARAKFYLCADLEERTRRRATELSQRGEAFELEGLKRQIEYRDKVDESRSVGPLRKARDAIEIDTTHLEPEALLQRLRRELAKRRG